MKISPQELAERLENFSQVCRLRHLPITPQKLAIFTALAASCQHPGVAEIYEQVKNQFPNISLATVYKNLKKFEDLNLITEIPITGEPARYDAKLVTHSHAVDSASGRVYDLEFSHNLSLPSQVLGKKVKRVNLVFYT